MTISSFKLIEYGRGYFEPCLALFDANCPEYFAINERSDYQDFLETSSEGYSVGVIDQEVVAAFGLTVLEMNYRARLSWILVSPKTKGIGIGRNMMHQVQRICITRNISRLDIAASHLSCSFFAKFGAIELSNIPNGWGAGMHRVDMQLDIG